LTKPASVPRCRSSGPSLLPFRKLQGGKDRELSKGALQWRVQALLILFTRFCSSSHSFQVLLQRRLTKLFQRCFPFFFVHRLLLILTTAQVFVLTDRLPIFATFVSPFLLQGILLSELLQSRFNSLYADLFYQSSPQILYQVSAHLVYRSSSRFSHRSSSSCLSVFFEVYFPDACTLALPLFFTTVSPFLFRCAKTFSAAFNRLRASNSETAFLHSYQRWFNAL
jgi:hypothetical protein